MGLGRDEKGESIRRMFRRCVDRSAEEGFRFA